MEETVEQIKRVPGLVGLRYVFAVFVMASHFQMSDGAILLPLGYCSVTFFFVLSGFSCMAGNESRFRMRSFSSTRFLQRQLLKIWPMHIVIFVVYLGLSILNSGYKSISLPTAILNATLLQSFVPVSSVFYSFNAVSWFLSDMIVMYVFFSLFGGSLRRTGPSLVLSFGFLAVTVGILIGGLVPEGGRAWFFYIFPFTRLGDFILGVAVFNLWKTLDHRLVLGENSSSLLEFGALSLLIVSLVFGSRVATEATYGVYFWLPMAGMIMTFALSRGGLLSRLLSSSLFQDLGNASLVFYMTHVMLIGVARRILPVLDPFIFIPCVLAESLLSVVVSKYLLPPFTRWVTGRLASS